MKLTYVLDYVFFQTPDGNVWTDTSYDAAFWEPYLAMYESVTVISRVSPVDTRNAAWKEVQSDRVHVAPLPLYRGALEYLQQSANFQLALASALKRRGAIVLRMPSNLARCAAKLLDAEERPYAVDVVGDPRASLAPGVVEMTGRPVFRSIFTRAQRRICARAIGVTYVASSLRANYPERPGALSLVCSDVRLTPEWFAVSPRLHRARKQLNLVTIATLSQTYKGIDVLLRALNLCQEREADYKLSLNVIGEGRYRASLTELAAKLGLADSVTFSGAIPWGPKLMTAIDAADLFVLPSRVEVMPRALLEAMARGLPAIATNVGAVAEVLDNRYVVEPGNARQLSERILSCVSRHTRLDAMSAANLSRADEFRAASLAPQWQLFHTRLSALFASQPQPLREPDQTPFAA